MSLEDLLYEKFGYTSFRSGQKDVIEALLQSKHSLAMLPTGTGKSICYQLPAYILNKPVLIISPLLSLMQDQAEQLRMNGEKSVITLNSFLTASQKRTGLEQLHRFRFIFLSPEMLQMDQVLQALQRLDIGLFVVDEAHCISQWGYDFRPNYLQLGEMRKMLSNPLTLALTATAKLEVREDIINRLGLEDVHQVVHSIDRENIIINVEEVASFNEKLERLLELAKETHGPVIVYFSSKKATESTAAYLEENGVANVGYYHGGMEQEQRMLIQQQFLNGQIRLICATSAFGMGINKENVRLVVHFHLPMGMESYIQEIGRAGRDGKQSAAVILYHQGDEGLPVHLQEQELPNEAQMDAVFHELMTSGAKANELSPESCRIWSDKYALSEVQLRLIVSFINARGELSLEGILKEMKQYMKLRKREKIEKFQAFFQWLFTKNCRREAMVRYFDEELQHSPDGHCCDNCGLSANYLSLIMQEKAEYEGGYSDWKQELARMLLKKEAEVHEK